MLMTRTAPLPLPHSVKNILVYVYKVHMCIYILRDLELTAFFFDIFFLPEKKSKRCERKPPIISNLKI